MRHGSYGHFLENVVEKHGLTSPLPRFYRGLVFYQAHVQSIVKEITILEVSPPLVSGLPKHFQGPFAHFFLLKTKKKSSVGWLGVREYTLWIHKCVFLVIFSHG
jgi:hypothetical protein